MKLPTSPGLDLTWRAVALAVADTIAAHAVAGTIGWVGSSVWGWLNS